MHTINGLDYYFDRISIHSNLFRHKGGSKKKTDEINIFKLELNVLKIAWISFEFGPNTFIHHMKYEFE